MSNQQPSLRGSPFPTSCWMSPFPTSLNGAGYVPPLQIEQYGPLRHVKTIAGLSPFLLPSKVHGDIAYSAAAMGLFSTRTDVLSNTDTGYTGSVSIGDFNRPSASGYREEINYSGGGEWTSLGWTSQSPWAHVDFTSVFTPVPTAPTIAITSSSYSQTCTDDFGVVTFSRVSTLGGSRDVVGMLTSACSAFAGATLSWGDNNFGNWYYDEWNTTIDNGRQDPSPAWQTLPSYTGALSRNEDESAAMNPFSPAGFGLSGVSAYTGWLVLCGTRYPEAENMGGNRVYCECSRILARHNNWTALPYWVGLYNNAAGAPVHVTSTGWLSKGQVIGLGAEVNLPMPPYPTVPLVNDGVNVYQGRYTFAVIGQTPAAWAAANHKTLVYD